MAQRTVALYDRIAPALPASVAAFEPARLRDALGYARWTPPPFVRNAATTQVSPEAPPNLERPSAPSTGEAPMDSPMVGGRLVRTALRLRQTMPGRLLYRLTPTRLRKTLKSRLG
jgi:hypothetical protein